ncbi:hypothetical protein EVAR_32021_1 [Eumeta japonica]|uniref:Uncharacterized protein n=1 Tax=Eumeta variegata TaxID=151549 RepID=A0A4C1YLJ6_EUMVA|nr:hypothetical protein EVAR_32021_1 [Eumeta japonica]
MYLLGNYSGGAVACEICTHSVGHATRRAGLKLLRNVHVNLRTSLPTPYRERRREEMEKESHKRRKSLVISLQDTLLSLVLIRKNLIPIRMQYICKLCTNSLVLRAQTDHIEWERRKAFGGPLSFDYLIKGWANRVRAAGLGKDKLATCGRCECLTNDRAGGVARARPGGGRGTGGGARA